MIPILVYACDSLTFKALYKYNTLLCIRETNKEALLINIIDIIYLKIIFLEFLKKLIKII